MLRHYVAPDHFQTFGVPLLRGRAFKAGRSSPARNRVAIINEDAAQALLAERGSDRQARLVRRRQRFERPDSSAEIVGIVGDVLSAARQRPFQRGLLHAVRAVHLRVAHGVVRT